MAIIQKTQHVDQGIPYNKLTYVDTFYACGYDDNTKTIMLITDEENPIQGGTKILSQLNGFGATSYQELIDEAVARGLVFPE